jgi:hypothetical protein
MEILNSIFPNFSQVFHIAFLVIVTYYGWVLFVLGLVYMLYFEYLEEIQGQFVRSVDWVFLEIKVPKDNKASTLAVESIFTQMHAMHSSLTFEEKYVQGRFQLWYSLEIVSFGGHVSFVIRTPKLFQHLVESSFYSQYPNAEISVVSDYMEKFHINPFQAEKEAYDIFGTEWKMSQNSVIPMKTYKDFEHPSAEEKVIDPMTNLIETFERISPDEFMAFQLLIQPIQNDEWHSRAEHKIKELIGEEAHHEASFTGFLLKPFEWFANFSYKETLFGSSHGHSEPENKPRNNWLSMTEGEKEKVALIERKANKANFNSKIRMLYICPKEKFDKGKRTEIIGSIRHLSPGGGVGIHNTLKVDSRTFTKTDPIISSALEGAFIEKEIRKRKYWFLRGFKNRSTYVGAAKFLLSVEEIATIFHFPITTESTLVPAGVGVVESKKGRAPANLPTADEV